MQCGDVACETIDLEVARHAIAFVGLRFTHVFWFKNSLLLVECLVVGCGLGWQLEICTHNSFEEEQEVLVDKNGGAAGGGLRLFLENNMTRIEDLVK